MRRGESGRYEITAAGGERVRAFVPVPLPPDPPVRIEDGLEQALASAYLALGRLDGISRLLSDPAVLLYSFIRKEALLSSQIEGTQSSLSDLLRFELKEAPGTPNLDVVEVSNHVAALEHGLGRLRDGFPLCNRLLAEVHGVLLSRGRGSDKNPGEFRRSQNWIGGSRPGNAAFVPPPPQEVPQCMTALERFLNDRDDGLPHLLRAGLAHVQFETIHPFLDGNGRVGRILVTLLLAETGVLREPLLYLSLYFKQHRSRYYELLETTRRTGDWERWLAFFLNGVTEAAESAVDTTERLVSLFERNRARVRALGRRPGSAAAVHEALRKRPLLSLSEASRRTHLTFRTVASAMEVLVELGIAREITGRRRGRLFVYEEFLILLNPGTESAPGEPPP